MEERDIAFSVVTESWFTDGKDLLEDLYDLEQSSGISIIFKNRPKRPRVGGRSSGGGVIIAFDPSKILMKERRIKGNVYELVGAQGKVDGCQTKVFTYGMYLPPQMSQDEVNRLCSLVAEDIAAIKARENDPVFFIMGDMNKKNVSGVYSCFDDIRELDSGPTRNGEKLDLCLSNVKSYDTEITPPLESDRGTTSDHDCLVISTTIVKPKDFVWEKIKTRKWTHKGVEGFGAELAATDWDSVLKGDINGMTEAFHGVLDRLQDRHFPFRTHKRRSNSHPWLTNNLRARLKKEKVIYRIEGKSTVWKALKRETLKRIEQKKQEFVEQAEKVSASDGGRTYFKAISRLRNGGREQRWDLMNLFPEDSQLAAAEKVRDYFGQVANASSPLGPAAPAPTGFRHLTEHEIVVRIGKAKKPKSSIPGDIAPALVSKYADLLAVPLKKIFNHVLGNADWPKVWKKEHITVIPKTSRPDGLAECRNISCTNFWSKLLESVLLDQLRNEISEDPVQFGGLKGCGAAHFLTEMWEEIFSTLDNPGKAVSLCSIDFSKAFNRMSHPECIKQLRALGASEACTSIVGSFLTGREMIVKIGDATAGGLHLKGGSPQGSILGCYLYCAATQQLGPELLDGDEALRLSGMSLGSLPDELPSPQPEARSPDGPFLSLSGPFFQSTPSARGQFAEFQPLDSSDEDSGPTTLRTFKPWNRIEDTSFSLNVDSSVYSVVGDDDNVKPAKMIKYIDDSNIIEEVKIDDGELHLTTHKRISRIRAEKTEGFVKKIRERSEDIGMVVNDKKTQALCITAQKHTEVRTVIQLGEPIVSGDSLRMLGFIFGRDPTAGAHISHLKDVFRKKYWHLINLRKAGLRGDALFHLYRVLILPILEYCSPVFHPLLTLEQEKALENLQLKAFRLSYGDISYKNCLEQGLVESLKARRERASNFFVAKAMRNKKFNWWFRRREEPEMQLRTRRPIQESAARTCRSFKSPIASFRRRANDLIASCEIEI